MHLIFVAAMMVACAGAQTPAPQSGDNAAPAASDDSAGTSGGAAADGERFGCNQAMGCVTGCGSDRSCSDACKAKVNDQDAAKMLFDFDNCLVDAQAFACHDQCAGKGPDCSPCMQDACHDLMVACQNN